MRFKLAGAAFLAAIFLGSSGAPAQMGARMPSFGGVFSPTVGEGAAYEVTTTRDNKKQQMEIAITGKEDYQGKTGYWMEMSMSGMPGGPAGMKSMVIVNGDQTTTMRMVMRMRNESYEMDMNSAMLQNHQKASPADVRKQSTRVGTETITVPAGTFTCEHWRMNDGGGDAWISEKVHPFGLVKQAGKDSSMVLLRLITDAKTKIPPPYKKFDPMEMMKQQQHP